MYVCVCVRARRSCSCEGGWTWEVGAKRKGVKGAQEREQERAREREREREERENQSDEVTEEESAAPFDVIRREQVRDERERVLPHQRISVAQAQRELVDVGVDERGVANANVREDDEQVVSQHGQR